MVFFIRAVVVIAQHDMNNTLQSKKKETKKEQRSPSTKVLLGAVFCLNLLFKQQSVKPREDASEITHKMFELLKPFSH